MKGIILGGATFVGYSVKNEIKNRNENTHFLILDLIRETFNLYKKPNEVYVDLRNLNYRDVFKFQPEFILINLYDLIDQEAVKINQHNNNILIEAINILVDVAIENETKVVIILNKHFYSTPQNKYQSFYNNFTKFIIKYFEIIAKVESIDIRMFLLPNVYGHKEAKRSVVRSVISKTQLQRVLTLEDTAREFLFIDEVVDHLLEDIFDPQIDTVFTEYSAEKSYSLIELYDKVTKITGKETYTSVVNPSYILRKFHIEQSKSKSIMSGLESSLYKYIYK